MINREHIKKTFDSYVKNYNLEDPKIYLKYEHTYYVATNCERIAKTLNLSSEDIDLAWCLGMFHDIGRFEQVRRYHTFQDKFSVNHAMLSADLLFVDGLINRFLVHSELDLMEKAIRLHNVYRLPEDLTSRERLFSDILRDADKVDILRVNCYTPREEIYNLPTEEFLTSSMTDEVFLNLMNKEPVNRKYSKTGIDFIMGHIGFVFDLAFDESKKIIKEQGYLDQLLNFESQNPQTNERMKKVKELVIASL
ncbi:Metal-dependent phosphohydrolase [Lachnospiraceae bacterium TWA4]|nr:Metal-dependent phosphohydrolase [Lachnospiraceae bacterium TWA4]